MSIGSGASGHEKDEATPTSRGMLQVLVGILPKLEFSQNSTFENTFEKHINKKNLKGTGGSIGVVEELRNIHNTANKHKHAIATVFLSIGGEKRS